MVAFYFPMPDRWRWDFWRYVVLVIAASTFWDNFNFWNSVEAGRSEIPWGSILGAGDAGGDMDRLVWQFGWRSAGIVDAYNRLADACLMVLMGVYIAFLVWRRSEILSALRQRTAGLKL